MKGILTVFPAWLAGIYLVTGGLDGIWDPLEWSGQQWEAGGCAIVILIAFSGLWHWWKTKK